MVGGKARRDEIEPVAVRGAAVYAEHRLRAFGAVIEVVQLEIPRLDVAAGGASGWRNASRGNGRCAGSLCHWREGLLARVARGKRNEAADYIEPGSAPRKAE